MQAGDAVSLIANLFEFESFSSPEPERLERLRSLSLSAECPEPLRLLLLEALYYESGVRFTSEHLESYLSALAALGYSEQLLHARRIFFPVLVREAATDLQEVRRRLEGRFCEEIQLTLLTNLALANRLDFAELGELSAKAKSKAAVWARAAAMWHALILARPIVPIWYELPPYSYNSLETALEDWSYAEEGSTQWLLDLGAISPRESEIFLEFGQALKWLLRSYADSLEDAWFTAPECAAIRAILERVFFGRDSLDCIFALRRLDGSIPEIEILAPTNQENLVGQNQWEKSQAVGRAGLQAGDATFLIAELFEFERISALDSERLERLRSLSLSAECPELPRLLLLEFLYYESEVQFTAEHLESYLRALAALEHPGRYLHARRIFFPVLVREAGVDLQEVRRRLAGRFCEEIQLTLLTNLVLANRLDFAELGELSAKAKSKAAAWARAVAMWHALILARPLVPIWAELPPYSYNSLETALEDWAYAEEGSTQWLLNVGAISARESEIFLEFGQALKSLLRGYSGSLEDAWFTAPECAAIRAILERVFSGQDSLAGIYALGET